MNFPTRYLAVLSVVGLFAQSCIENDMSYPRQRAEFSAFEVEDAVSVGDTVRVKYLGTDEKGRQNLSMKDAD